jgi:hypothetical protein
MLSSLGYTASYVSIDPVRRAFKQQRKFSRKKIIKVKDRSLLKSTLEDRRKFVCKFIPYIIAQENNQLDIWYVDESGFNINPPAGYGWAKRGKYPV